MVYKENVSLKKLNTFGIDCLAKTFTEFNSIEQLQEILNENNSPLLVLGGGSNVLLTRDFNGLVIRNNIRGIEVLEEDEERAILKVGAGEVWHNFVLFCIANKYAGVENLSLIPGSVGAGPMQNIGAYGVELKEVFYQLEAMHVKDKTLRTFDKQECKFGYRNSIFKNEVKNQYIIVNVTFQLSKKPILNTTYGAIEEELKKMSVSNPTIKDVSDAVCNIRRSKLPDPAVIGNAGSFFKNPEVTPEKFNSLKQGFPSIVGYPTVSGMKIAAGWMIEQCGWKGKRVNDAGVHEKQALVLVNYGNAKGNEIFDLAKNVRKSVKEKFGVELEMEVNII